MTQDEIQLLAVALYWRYQFTEAYPNIGWTTLNIIFDDLLKDPKLKSIKPTDIEVDLVTAKVKKWISK